MRRQRSFVPQLRAYVPADSPTYAARVEHLRAFADRYPGYSEWPAEEALLVSALVLTLEDQGVAYVARITRKCGLTVPAKLRHDRYRLIKYLFAHWPDPAMKERILTKAIIVKQRQLLREMAILTPQMANREIRRVSPTYLLGPMLALGLKADVEALVSMLDDEALAYYQGDVVLGQIICHLLWRERDPIAVPLWERRRLMQRLQRRTYHLQRLNHSLYQMDRERKAVLRLSWEAERAAGHLLDQLIREQERVETQIREAVVHHARKLSALQARQAEELQAMRDRLEARRAALDEALVERRHWNRPLPLAGQTVLIVGGAGQEAGYRSVIAQFGGRPVVVDGVDRLNRIREVAPEADVAILISSAAKHAAEAALTAAVRPDCLLLYCPRVGQASLERTLRAEVLPRQIALQVAASQEGGGNGER